MYFQAEAFSSSVYGLTKQALHRLMDLTTAYIVKQNMYWGLTLYSNRCFSQMQGGLTRVNAVKPERC